MMTREAQLGCRRRNRYEVLLDSDCELIRVYKCGGVGGVDANPYIRVNPQVARSSSLSEHHILSYSALRFACENRKYVIKRKLRARARC